MTPTSPNNPGQELAGQVAVVTGASQGIGRAIALTLAAAGADLILHTRARRAQLESLAQQIREQGRHVDLLLGDLSTSDRCRQLVDAAWEKSSGISIWINNAGADVLTGQNAALSFEAKLQHLWNVDVAATMHLSRLAGQRLKESATADRVILNVGWDQAEFGMAGDSGEMFAAIKGAVMAFSKSLAKSLAPDVRVNCVAPGWIRTQWGENAEDYWQQRACRESLLQRWGTPEDVAEVARFLVSPAAAFVTGQVIPVNGGYRGSMA